MKKIAIITICYNHCEGLRRTIESVVHQTFSDREFIVVDGDSNDGTHALLEQYNSQIDKIICEKDDGIYDAINKGIKAATSEWIVCMNAGDVFANDDVLTQVFSETLPDDISFIYSDYFMRTKNGSLQKHTTNRQKGNVFHQSAIYKRSLHAEHGYYQVTHPYTVSDLMFMLSVPESAFHKISTPISISEYAGNSDSLWCARDAFALRVVYGYETFASALLKYIKATIRQKLNLCLKKFKTT